MKITYNNETIDFFDFEIPKKLIVSLSGGLDSAAAMYLTCKHFPQIEIIPFTCRDISLVRERDTPKDAGTPKDAEHAVKIVKWMQHEFPHVKIRDTEITDFNDKDESIISWKQCDEAIKSVDRFAKLNRVKVSKIIQMRDIAQKMVDNNPGAIRLDGMTRNPPIEEMISLGFYNKAETRRDHGAKRPQHYQALDTYMYQVFTNVDKKFVADIYKQNNLMETLYPLTTSCVGTWRWTDNYTKDCHRCFWCYEKKWAFNLDWKE